MAERIEMDRPFRPSYRPEKRAGGIDPDMKRMGMLAAGIGGVLALLFGGAILLRPAHHGIPVVEPEAGPVRVKPVDAGGMQVTGADIGAGMGAQHLAPAAEQPQINALKAQVRELKKEVARQSAETAHTEKLAQAAVAAPRVAPAPPVHNVVATVRMAGAEPVAGSASRRPEIIPAPGTMVQLAAYSSQTAAHAGWDKLLKRSPDLLGGRRPLIVSAVSGGKTVWRLRAGGFASVPEAEAFCGRVKARGGDCSIAAF